MYDPLPWQIPAFRCTDPVMLLTGSAGGGKSRVAAEKIVAYCIRYPGSEVLVVRKTRESCYRSTERFVASLVAGVKGIEHEISRHAISFGNGSRITFGGMADDKQRESVRSLNLDLAWMEEATQFREEDYNELLARMRGTHAPWRQVIMTTNPDAPTHWIRRRMMEDGEATVFTSRAADNTHNPASYKDVLAKMTGFVGKRLRDGEWSGAHGLVYDEYDPTVHIVEALPKGHESWDIVRSIDFGYTNPFVCLWAKQDHDGVLYLYREHYRRQMLVEDHAKAIIAHGHGEEDRIVSTVADHDAEGIATLRAHGIHAVDRADKTDRAGGIQAVKQRLADRRLFIVRDTCPKTLEEIAGYVWREGARNEEPEKENDHAMDALRYLVRSVDAGSSHVMFMPRREREAPYVPAW